MEIELRLGVTYSEKKVKINLEDYGMNELVWDEMSNHAKDEWLLENVVDEFDSPAWAIDSFKDTDNKIKEL